MADCWLSKNVQSTIFELLGIYLCFRDRSRTDGNPRHLACFLDESLNGTLARVCRSAHRSVWHYRVLANFEQCEARRLKRKVGD